MTNQYLQHLIDYKESEVPYYDKKVGLFISGGYSHMLSAFIINFLANILAALIVSTLVSNAVKIDQMVESLIVIIVAIVVVSIVSFIMGKKRMHKYVDINHGEVGHKGEKMYTVVKKNAFVCAIIALGLAVLLFVLYFLFGVEHIFTIYTLDILNYALILPGSVSAYFFGAINYCDNAKFCPFCGRINTYSAKKLSSIGSKFEGYSTKITARTTQVGTKYTTTKTTYSDGSVSHNTTSSPIYGQVYTEHTYENSSTIDQWLLYCTECPGTFVSTSIEMHKKEVARREL